MKRFFIFLCILFCVLLGISADFNEDYAAMIRADQYMAIDDGWSKSGLIEQLQFEGFSYDSAYNAVDTIAVDWKKQAYNKLRDYMSLFSMSRSDLWNQLRYEGFTEEQIRWAFDEADGVHSPAYQKRLEEEAKARKAKQDEEAKQKAIDKILYDAKDILLEYIAQSELTVSTMDDAELKALDDAFDKLLLAYDVPDFNKEGLKKNVIWTCKTEEAKRDRSKNIPKAENALQEYIVDNEVIIAKMRNYQIEYLNESFDEILSNFNLAYTDKKSLKEDFLAELIAKENDMVRQAFSFALNKLRDTVASNSVHDIVSEFILENGIDGFYYDYIEESLSSKGIAYYFSSYEDKRFSDKSVLKNQDNIIKTLESLSFSADEIKEFLDSFISKKERMKFDQIYNPKVENVTEPVINQQMSVTTNKTEDKNSAEDVKTVDIEASHTKPEVVDDFKDLSKLGTRNLKLQTPIYINPIEPSKNVKSFKNAKLYIGGSFDFGGLLTDPSIEGQMINGSCAFDMSYMFNHKDRHSIGMVSNNSFVFEKNIFDAVLGCGIVYRFSIDSNWELVGKVMPAFCIGSITVPDPDAYWGETIEMELAFGIKSTIYANYLLNNGFYLGGGITDVHILPFTDTAASSRNYLGVVLNVGLYF